MKVLSIMLFLLLIGLISVSAQNVWHVDPAHSNVQFSIKHLVISEVTGNFKNFDITLTQTKDDFSDSEVKAVIDMNSINTDNEKRDNHLRSDDFFNAESFPEMTFVSKSFKKSGKDNYKIKGDLTIRDITKSVTLDTKFNGIVVDPYGNTKSGFKATTTINRFDFDVKWSAAIESGGLVAGKEVDVTLNIQLKKQK